CVRSPVPTPYQPATACGSIETGLAVAEVGDAIVMKAGRYGPQSITAVKPSPGCAVTSEPGVVTGKLTTAGAWYRLDGITVDVGSTHGARGSDAPRQHLTVAHPKAPRASVTAHAN